VKEALRAMEGGGQVRLDLRGEVARLTLDNPARRNAMSGQMLADLGDAVESLEAWQGAALILKGSGGWFCAGADLDMVAAHLSPEDGLAMCRYMQDILGRLRDLKCISVALVEGAALGGGAELLTACDFRIVDQEARIQFLQVRLGLSTGWGGGLRLVALVGRQKALRILGGAESLDAEAARDLGLADEVCAAGTGEAALQTFLAPYLEASPSALRAMKTAIVAGSALDPEALAAEAAAFGEVWGGTAHREALAHRRPRK
jgi:ethylmalonyl-CoA/methylmalonyl-CoA decarboxylase